MKNILLLLFLAQAAFAQKTGSIKYEQVIKFDMTPAMKAALHGVTLPDQKSSFELDFSEEESLYKKLDTKEENNSNVRMMGADAKRSTPNSTRKHGIKILLCRKKINPHIAPTEQRVRRNNNFLFAILSEICPKPIIPAEPEK